MKIKKIEPQQFQNECNDEKCGGSFTQYIYEKAVAKKVNEIIDAVNRLETKKEEEETNSHIDNPIVTVSNYEDYHGELCDRYIGCSMLKEDYPQESPLCPLFRVPGDCRVMVPERISILNEWAKGCSKGTDLFEDETEEE